MNDKEKIEDGGPAFPSDQPIFMVPSDMPQEWKDKCASIAGKMNGMSLRNWFAGMALQGLLSDPQTLIACKAVSEKGDRNQNEIIATVAYELADTMIKEGTSTGPLGGHGK